MKRAIALVIVGLLTVLVGVSVPRSLRAQSGGIPSCDTLTNPVYMAGTTAVLPVIRLMGARLKKANVTLLWNENDDGCHAVSALVDQALLGTPTASGRTVYSQYDEPADQPGKVIVTTCSSPVNTVPDLVINDVSWSSCQASYSPSSGVSVPLPPGVKEFQGPVQGLVPIVPSSYTYYNDITVEELQDLYICGARANILTFSLNNFIFDYNAVTSGMRELWARGIGVSRGSDLSNLFQGNSNVTAETMVTVYVAPSTSPDQTIGYTSTEFYDQYRDRVRGLKVRGLNQKLAYWPDMQMTTTDKINIREGRYTLQGALRLITAVDANGVPTSLGAQHLIDWFQQNATALPLPFDVTEIYALKGVVPQCAMKVTRDGDASPFKHYKHPQPCHCSFQVLATGNTSIAGCVPCAGVDAGTCQTGQMCSHGYCEQVQ